MKTSTKMFALMGLSLALVANVWAGDEKASKNEVAKVGEAAPAFTLKDTKGTEHKLSDFAGKTVVIEWFNPDCPFCRGVYDNGVVKKTLDELKTIDPSVVYLAINSTAKGMNGPVSKQDVIATSDKFLAEHNMTQIPVLIDHEGTVGHAYGAKTTPHMFIIDGKGTLRYAGAFTDDPKGDKKDKPTTNYVVNAVKQIKAGETVSPDSTKSWGCGVKYADKGEGMGKPEGAPHKGTDKPARGH
jgi:peroxiredoxin